MPFDSLVSHDTAAADDERVLTIKVRMPDGGRLEAGALAGHQVMEMLRAHGLPMRAACGGAGVCATCHVRVPAAWRGRLPAASQEELAKLDEVPDADDSSRLACQLMMTSALDGLELELHPDSLIPQTYWIAG